MQKDKRDDTGQKLNATIVELDHRGFPYLSSPPHMFSNNLQFHAPDEHEPTAGIFQPNLV